MDNYVPPFTISHRMLEMVADIAEKVGRISSVKKLDNRPQLRRFWTSWV